MNKLLVLVAGLPGVGKSTISRMVSKYDGATVVDVDDFKRVAVDLVLVKEQIDPPELRWVYYQKALEHVFGLFDQGRLTVIMDEVFHLRSLRSKIEALAESRHVEVLWVEVRCPLDMVQARLSSTQREEHLLSSEEALRMYHLFKEIFEPFPEGSENHVVINNDGASGYGLINGILDKIY
ncbi:MAG: AAA family ATPase [bacterium]|nr:AAA family ATPase [bacterium]